MTNPVAIDVITLFLLHPLKQTPIQVWPFENESVIRIGRSTDNDVVLYSAVVSRRHVELRKVGHNWDIVNLGTNGTYLDGKRIEKVAVEDGTIIRLARSGPNIQIRLGSDALKELPDHLLSSRQNMSRNPSQINVTEMIDPLRLETQNSNTHEDETRHDISSGRYLIQQVNA
ncbi:MAG: FHA domain-containing protein [Leptolyngbyaceae cyanobacterium]